MIYLKNCIEVSDDEILSYFADFSANEYCYVLRQLYEMDITEWRKRINTIHNTLFFAMYDDDRIVGVGRISHKPVHHSSGNIGYGIRPHERRKGYGTMLVSMLCSECYLNDISCRACVEHNNIPSIKTMEKSGFYRNGIVYDWGNGRTAYEYIK